jgi:hypothetical protein
MAGTLKLNYKTRMAIKNCIYLIEAGSLEYLTDAEKEHTEETLILLKQLRDIGVKAGPSCEREEVAPGHWDQEGGVDYPIVRLEAAHL